MNKLLITVLIIISLVILNTKLKGDIQEGFTQCEYRKKQNTGTMCNEKWGEPECNKWEPINKIKEIKDKKIEHVENKFIPLRGYQLNSFMYEVDYENNEEEKEGEPKGVHSSFFA